MSNNSILLCIFWVCALFVGFCPSIYTSVYNSFVGNQLMWVFGAVIFFYMSKTKEEKIISKSLILATVFELSDELLGLNTYSRELTHGNLRTDYLITILLIIYTIYKLYKNKLTNNKIKL